MPAIPHPMARRHGRPNPPVVMPADVRNPQIKSVKVLIWIYFWLLIFEGALRKWTVEALSGPLLLVRDPVVLLIYLQAARGRLFPRTLWLTVIWGMMAMFAAWGAAQSFTGSWENYVVAAYGVRTFFLHLPLIFVIGRVFAYEDVVKLGKWIMLLSIPMTALMVAQYEAPPSSFINCTVFGEDSRQIAAALGHIRPPGTFSFITGPAAFYPLVTAFCLLGLFTSGTYRWWLIIAAGAATIMVLPASGSRTLVLACAVVCAGMFVVVLLKPSILLRMVLSGLAVVVLGLGLLGTPVGKSAVTAFTQRWDNATESEGQGEGAAVAVTNRVGGSFTEVFYVMDQIPFSGVGLGVGTNVGSGLLSGRVGVFIAGESEWTRIVSEAGVVLGFSYILLRVSLAFALLGRAWQRLRQGNMLPWLLMSTAFIGLVMGQTTQPTALGFMVFGAGLALAAMNPMPEERLRAAAGQRHLVKTGEQRRTKIQADTRISGPIQ